MYLLFYAYSNIQSSLQFKIASMILLRIQIHLSILGLYVFPHGSSRSSAGNEYCARTCARPRQHRHPVLRSADQGKRLQLGGTLLHLIKFICKRQLIFLLKMLKITGTKKL